MTATDEPGPGRPPRRGRRPGPPRHLADLDPAARRAAAVDLGLPAFRADQASRHYFAHLSDDPGAWTDVPGAARGPLRELLPVLLAPAREQVCDDGATRKTLWRLADGALVEGVLMRYGGRRAADGRPRPDRVTVCVSSQAGCAMGCPFCATGQGGLVRNLSAAEVVAQVAAGMRAARDDGARLSNVVFMGMGEPLANWSALATALRRLVDDPPTGLGLSARGVTVSTVGLVPRIGDLAALGLPVTLAVSLHAPDDALRDTLVPVNTRWPVAQVLDAARAYARTTGRRVSVEYALIRDVNDQAWRADLLAAELLARGRGWAHVNLIPLNPTPGSAWTASRPADEREFLARLQRAGCAATVRDTRGREIDGACGQLAAAGA